MSARRPMLAVLATTAALGGTLAYGGVSALAATESREAITSLGPFTYPQGVAVDQANGNVLIVDGTPSEGLVVNRVEVFDEAGATPPAGGAPAQLTGAETPSGSLEVDEGSEAAGVAVDNSCFYQKLNGAACTSFDASNEDVYVADPLHGVLDKFRRNGSKYEYVCEINGWYGVGGQACLAGGGAPEEALGGARGVATDAEGNVYVAGHYVGVVYEYNAKGEGVRRFTPAVEEPKGVAVSPGGDLYVLGGDENNFAVELKRNPLGEPVEERVLGRAEGIAFDPVSEHLLGGGDAGGITEYDSEGRAGLTFGVGVVGKAWDIAANASSGRLYISDDGNGDVDVYGPLGVLASLATTYLSGTQSTSITLNGTVNPEGLAVAGCRFEYGPTGQYGSSVPCSPAPGSGESPVAVSASLSGLAPHTLYHYRIVAVNDEGTNATSDETFLTGASVDDRPAYASNVSQFAVTLNGTVSPGSIPTSYHFVYGTSTAYGQVAPTPDAAVPPADGDVQVEQELTGLAPGTTYHFALVANSPAGSIVGPDEQFTTAAIPPPLVSTGASSGATVSAVTLTGTIDPQGWDTGYRFEYGTSTAYGASWPTIDIDMGALTGSQPVTIYLQNLLPATTYHYRLVAENGGGIGYGADQTFTTEGYPASVVQATPLLQAPIVKSGTAKSTGTGKHKQHAKGKRKAARGKRRVKAKHKRKRGG
jgi:hypothetical protein